MESLLVLPGEFTLGSRLATGGMGDVWLGTDRRSGDEVAIKVFRPRQLRDAELLRSLRREVAAAARLDHPNIIEIVDWNVVPDDLPVADGRIDAGSPYIVMEYAGGGSLEPLRGLLDGGEIVGVLRHVLRALAHSHARGVVHRDIKPPNILFSRRDALSGTWKLGDFGIARILANDAEAGESLRTVQVVGTPPYMAPEQFSGLWHDFGPWTDIYAVGVVAWELIFGALPFPGPNLVDFASQHVREELPSLAPVVPVPAGLVDWVRRALSKDPALRFRNAAEARSALDAVPGIPDDTGPWVGAPAALGTRHAQSPHRTFVADMVGAPITHHALTVATLHDSTSVTRAERSHVSAPPVEPAGAFAQPEQSGTGESADSTDVSRLTQSAARLSPRRGATPSALIALRSSSASTPPPPRSSIPTDWRTPAARARRSTIPTTSLIGLRPTRPVGREAERDALWGALRDVITTGNSRAILLQGVAGTGKSHLAEWIGELADEMLGCFVLFVQHDADDNAGEALARALTRRLRCSGLHADEIGPHLSAALRPWGIGRAHELAAVQMLATATTTLSLPDGTVLRFENARERHAALGRLLGRLSAERPAVVVIDDAQWAADLLGAIRQICTTADVVVPRVLFVVSAQTETLAERLLERTLLEELLDGRWMQRLAIGPLPEPDARTLATEGLGLSPAAASSLVERTGGNPMVAVQAIAAWHEAGVLIPGDQGLSVADTIVPPAVSSLDAIWDARIRQALAEARDEDLLALEALAALGVHVRNADAHETWRRLGVRLDERVLRRLVRASLLAESPGEYRFAHPTIRAAFEQRTLSAGRERRVHEACHDMLLARQNGGGGSRARRAQHLLGCGRHDEAVDLMLADAAELVRASDYGTAELRLDSAAAVLQRTGAARDDLRLRTAVALRADILRLRWRFDEAEAICIAVLEVRSDDTPARRARATLAKVARQRGRADEAERIGSTLFAEVSRLGETDAMADAMLSLAIVARIQGRFETASERYLAAERLYETLGDPLGVAHVRLGLAHLYRMHGDNAQAEAHYADARLRFERLGNRHEAANCLAGAAEIARFDGRLDAALAGYREALALQRAVGARDVTITELNIALVEIARADYTAARNRLRRVIDRMSAAGQTGYLPYARIALLSTHAGLGDDAAWDREASATFAQLDTSGLVDRDIAEQLEIAGQAWVRRAHHRQAREALERARLQRLRLSQKV